MFFLLAYKQKLNGRTLHKRKYGAGPRLWKTVTGTAWNWWTGPVLEYSAENLDKYLTTIRDFISKCGEDCLPKKSIQVFPNCKAWMHQEIHSLLKTSIPV
eukprot:g34964.t1